MERESFVQRCRLASGVEASSITVDFAQIGLAAGQTAAVRDLWQHGDLGVFTGSHTATNVPSHGVAMLRIVGQ